MSKRWPVLNGSAEPRVAWPHIQPPPTGWQGKPGSHCRCGAFPIRLCWIWSRALWAQQGGNIYISPHQSYLAVRSTVAHLQRLGSSGMIIFSCEVIVEYKPSAVSSSAARWGWSHGTAAPCWHVNLLSPKCCSAKITALTLEFNPWIQTFEIQKGNWFLFTCLSTLWSLILWGKHVMHQLNTSWVL